MSKTPAAPSSALRTPLNDILGAQANVRLLRALVCQSTPLGKAELARRAGMTPQGGRKAIDRLFDAGIVQYVGSGSRQQVVLRSGHPLASALVRLFQAEAARYKELIHALKTSVSELERPPKAVWIQGRIPQGVDEYGDPLILGVLAKAAEVDDLAERLREALMEVERKHDVTIEVRPYSEADIAALSLHKMPTITIFGPDPSAFIPVEDAEKGSRIRQHRDYDERALHRARRLADLLVREPALRERALVWVDERLREEGENRELREWQRILNTTSPARLRRLLTSDTDRAVRLRQSLPFWSVLSKMEQQEILAGRNHGPRST